MTAGQGSGAKGRTVKARGVPNRGREGVGEGLIRGMGPRQDWVRRQGGFKSKARRKQGTREIHKLFAKELTMEKSPLYIINQWGCVPNSQTYCCTAAIINRKSSTDKFFSTNYQSYTAAT